MKLREFAERYAEAWSSQDAGRLAAFYSPEGRLRVNDGAPAIGRKAIAEVARSFMTAFPDMRVVLDELRMPEKGRPRFRQVSKGRSLGRLQGDCVEFHWVWTGTNSGPGGTGRRVRMKGFEVWTMGEDGLIASSEGHYDEEEYRRQVERRGVGFW